MLKLTKKSFAVNIVLVTQYSSTLDVSFYFTKVKNEYSKLDQFLKWSRNAGGSLKITKKLFKISKKIIGINNFFQEHNFLIQK